MIIGVIFMGSCKSTYNNTEPEGEYEIIENSQEYINPDYGRIIQDYVNDADTALRIADAVLQGIFSEKELEEFVDYDVSYDKQKGIWIVNRNVGPYTLGGDLTCAIRRSNGEILMVVFGE